MIGTSGRLLPALSQARNRARQAVDRSGHLVEAQFIDWHQGLLHVDAEPVVLGVGVPKLLELGVRSARWLEFAPSQHGVSLACGGTADIDMSLGSEASAKERSVLLTLNAELSAATRSRPARSGPLCGFARSPLVDTGARELSLRKPTALFCHDGLHPRGKPRRGVKCSRFQAVQPFLMLTACHPRWDAAK